MKKSLVFISFLLYQISAHEWRCDYEAHEECGGWLKFHDVPMTWDEARLTCHYEGAELATPTPNLIDVMTNVVKLNNIVSAKIFTGIHATYSRRHFTSIEGVPLANIFHKWAEAEPNNKNNQENCIALNQYGTLEDISCNITLPFICYKKNESEKLNICGTLDNEYTLDIRTGSCYKFHRFPHSWERANMICEAEGGYLAIINSDTEAQVIKDVFARNPKNTLPQQTYPDLIFLGFRDASEHNEWITLQGQTIKEAGYDKFSEGKPADFTLGRYCGGAYRTILLADLLCDAYVPFICEKDPKSLTCNN